MKSSRDRGETKFAYALLAPSLILILLLIGYPMVYNVIISFQHVPLNSRMSATFVGLKNYLSVLKDTTFYQSVLVTFVFTAVVTFFSTAVGLAMAIYLDRDFACKKLVNGIILLSYVVPSVCLIFAWRYMFNNIYGIVNYVVVDVLHLTGTVPLWFDQPVSAFLLTALFSIWRFFPYAYLAFVAILQSIDRSLYEAADIDGATSWDKFRAITFPAMKSTLATVVSLRIIWVFYIYAEVYLLTKQVNVIGVYLYDMAFATHDFGKAACISILLFFVIFACIIFVRKKVLRYDEEET